MSVSDNFNGWANRKKSHDKIILAISIIAAVVVVTVVLFVTINKGHNSAPVHLNDNASFNSSENSSNNSPAKKSSLSTIALNGNNSFASSGVFKSMKKYANYYDKNSLLACSDNLNFANFANCSAGDYIAMFFRLENPNYDNYSICGIVCPSFNSKSILFSGLKNVSFPYRTNKENCSLYCTKSMNPQNGSVLYIGKIPDEFLGNFSYQNVFVPFEGNVINVTRNAFDKIYAGNATFSGELIAII